jgi:3,4-dihydroxy 2-butanone 4-phosphate synthase/GTP cyclohydrolase II
MTTQEVAHARVLKAIEAVKAGGMVIMVDDEDRENEGDLVFAATAVTPEKINFMTKEARGLICLSLDQASIDRLKLPMMEDSTRRAANKTTAFTVSIEARDGVTTGISAADRARTVQVAIDPATTPDEIVVPGHIFPLKAKAGGVLQRAGHTEGSVDLARLAGLQPSAVICEIMNEDGTMARMPDLEAFSAKHGIPIVTIADLISFRLLSESLVEEVRQAPLTTPAGELRAHLFRSMIDATTHLALVKGERFDGKVVDVRVHRQRPFLDVIPRSGGAAVRSRLDYGFEMLKEADAGVLLYMTNPDALGDMATEFDALVKTASPADGSAAGARVRPWPETDPRMLGTGAQILRALGVRQMRVHMTTPSPLKGLNAYGLEVVAWRRVGARCGGAGSADRDVPAAELSLD